MDTGFQPMPCQEASWVWLLALQLIHPSGHCEERSDEAISSFLR